MVLPIFSYTFFGGAGGRLKIMSLFSYPRSENEASVIVQQEGGTTTRTLEYQVFHGAPIYFLRIFTEHYLNHFSPRFLFFEGDWTDPRHSVPMAGQMNYLDMVFLPAGLYFLISRKLKNQSFMWYFLLISPLPAALTRNIIQANRSFFMVLPLTMLSAFGMYFIWQLVREKKLLRIPIVTAGVIVYLFSFISYLDQFFVHAPIQYSDYWLYGYKQAVQFIAGKTQNYSRVIFTQKYGQPYMYYLFYTKYSPEKYQKQAKLVENPEGDVGMVTNIDNIEFRDIYWPADRFKKNSLFIGTQYELPLGDIAPKESKVLQQINFLNGTTAFRIVETLK
jgi:hypothetical protein